MKKLLKTALILLHIVIFLSSCTNSIKIGANLELSGAFSPYGQPAKDAMIFAVEEVNENGGVNGEMVEILFSDNRSNAVDSVGATLNLKQRGAKVIFGPTIGTLTKASLCSNVDTLVITPSATADVLTQMDTKTRLIRLCFNDTAQANAMAKFAIQNGFCTATVLTDLSSDYSRGTSKAFMDTFGGSVTQHFFLSGDTDFTAVLSHTKKFAPQCIYLPGYYTEAGVIIKQARQLGIYCPILSGDALDSPLLNEIVGDTSYLKEVYYTAHTARTPEYEEFENRFLNRFGYLPNTYAALMYDSVKLYLTKLAENGIQNVENALFNTVGYKGVCGEVTLLPNGECLKTPVIAEFGGG